MVDTIEYWSNAADDAFPTRLVVTRNKAELEVMSNEDNPAVPNIGRFSMAADAPKFEQLAAAVATPAFAKHANPDPIEPGEVIRKLTVRFADGHEVRRHVEGSAPGDAGFASAEQQALRMAAEVRRHPRQVVSIAMTTTPGATRDDHILNVTLSNAGAESLALPHPGQWLNAGMALHVTARRTDIPLAQMSNEHQAFLELGQKELASAPIPIAPRITLAPGQSQVFSFSAHLPLPPGKYEMWAAFIVQLLSEQGNEFMLGELVSPRLAVKR